MNRNGKILFRENVIREIVVAPNKLNLQVGGQSEEANSEELQAGRSSGFVVQRVEQLLADGVVAGAVQRHDLGLAELKFQDKSRLIKS